MAAVAAVAAVGVSALVIGPAGAQGPAPKKLRIVGTTTMQAGKFIKDNQRFAPRNLEVRSGQTVRLANKAKTEDPHTLTLMRRSDLPRTAAEAFNCDACNAVIGPHFGDEENGVPPQPVINVGDEGFDQPGDSIFVPPGGGGTVRFDVTADRGTTLHYLCAFHPWMQGKFRVR
jgi:plastocyanin